MTEQEWLEGDSPEAMLGYLGRTGSKRKLLLFSCACERRLWDLPDCERDVVVGVERYADGEITPEKLQTVIQASRQSEHYTLDDIAGMDPFEWAWEESYYSADYAANLTTRRRTGKFRNPGNEAEWLQALRAEQAAQAELLRDIFGNPFRPVVRDSHWLTATVIAMVRAIYEERRFQDMAILADALEEAGCTDAATLAHCRAPGEHVRGCWVLDLVLGRE